MEKQKQGFIKNILCFEYIFKINNVLKIIQSPMGLEHHESNLFIFARVLAMK